MLTLVFDRYSYNEATGSYIEIQEAQPYNEIQEAPVGISWWRLQHFYINIGVWKEIQLVE